MRVPALLKDSRFLGFIGILALCLFIWFAGSYIAIGNPPEPLSAVTRLVVILVLILLWAGITVLSLLKQKQQNNSLISEIDKQSAASATSEPIAGASAEESAQLQTRFKEALTTLKGLKFGDKGKQTVYELPWYLVIGPPGAGKTTLLANSGLQFPLKEKFGLKGIGGIGGTRNCDWWFTNQAVLIDTAGRYTTQDSNASTDKSAWLSFLSLLKKHRPRRAINGVIVAISASELLMLSKSERLQHAETIRNRVQELMSELQIRFPIYFMVTKTDLIAGFTEYFEEMGQIEREQVWGMTFPFSDKITQQSNLDFLGGELDALVKRVNDRLLWRLHNERDPKRRSRIQNFPNQFEQLQDVLEPFVKEIFAENRYQTPPLLRGVYFTSGTQEGSPIDRILSSLSAGYGINVNSLASPAGQGKSFFINRFLGDLVFQEANIVGLNTTFEKRLKLLRRVLFGAMGAFGVATLGVWTYSLIHNQSLMNQVTELVDQHKTNVSTYQQQATTTPESVESVITPLYQATSVYQGLSLPWLTGMGLYDSSVADASQNAYLASLRTYLLPMMKSTLEQDLKTPASDEALYNALRVYLLLGDPGRMEPIEITRWFQEYWSTQLPGKAAIQQRYAVYLSDFLSKGFTPITYQPDILAEARAKARQVPVERRIYNQIRNEKEYARKTDLVNVLGRSLTDVYNFGNNADELKIPYLFSKSGYDSLDLSENSPLVRKFASEQWILGTENVEDFTDQDIKDIAEKVKTIYLAEYSETWFNALKSLHIKDIANMTDARDALKVLTSASDSPLIALLELTRKETGLTPQINLLTKAGEKNSLAGEAVAALQEKALPPTLVDKNFTPLQQFVDNKSIDTVITDIKALADLLEGFSLSPSQAGAAFSFSKGRFEGSAADPIRKLLIRASQSPEPVNRWLTELADQSWKVVLVESKSHIDSLWQAKVYQSYQAGIANRFPFSRNASEVALIDFTEYFKPGGTEQSFKDQFLKPFISEGKTWSNKSLNDRGLGISNEALEQMRRADTIRSVFFRKSASAPAVDFTLKPRQMDSSVRRFELSIGDQKVRYSHGPKLPNNLTWPANSETTVRMLFEDINETLRDKTFTGEWAFFRALDALSIEKTGKASQFYVTFDVEGRKANYELTAKSFLNPFESSWMRSYRCPGSL